MEIKRIDSQPTASSSARATAGQEGPAEWLPGSVRIQPVFESPEPARARARASRSRRVHAQRSIRIHSVRR
jgi:hypothetical protein